MAGRLWAILPIQILIRFTIPLCFTNGNSLLPGRRSEFDPPLTVLPFPVSDGWTFVGDSSNTNTYPVYDSIVFYEWEFFIARPQIAINKEGFYGLLSAAEQVDTLEAFEYDSLFYFGANYFGRKNGTWTNWQLQWNFPKWDLKTKPFGKVERWFRDEMGLYFWQNGK